MSVIWTECNLKLNLQLHSNLIKSTYKPYLCQFMHLKCTSGRNHNVYIRGLFHLTELQHCFYITVNESKTDIWVYFEIPLSHILYHPPTYCH